MINTPVSVKTQHAIRILQPVLLFSPCFYHLLYALHRKKEVLFMKRSPVFACIVLCALFMMLFSSSMLAETPLSPEVVALVQAAFPSHRILLSDQCGRTAAAVLSDGQTQVLCLAEQTDGDWALTVSNPTAFDPDRAISSLKLNADDSLCWTYALDGFLTETHHAVLHSGAMVFSGHNIHRSA